MAIPKKINRTHVLRAIDWAARNGVPDRRLSTKFVLVFGGRHYPPKYLLSLASRLATGREHEPEEFSGGPESNGFLKSLGFEIKNLHDRQGAPATASPLPAKSPDLPPDEAPRTMIGRIIIKGAWRGDLPAARKLLLELADQLKGKHSFEFLMGPGGFLLFDWPRDCHPTGPDDRKALAVLKANAEKTARKVLTDRIRTELSGIARYFSFGVDASVDDDEGCSAVELVGLCELRTGRLRWTGKTYPTPAQEQILVRVNDLDSHFMNLDGRKVLVLGCHDLNLFSPRSASNAVGWRQETIQAFLGKASRFSPEILLQHPHTTDSPNIWGVSWSGVRQNLPSVKHAAGSGLYHNWSCKPRRPLDATLKSTAFGDVKSLLFDTRLGRFV